MIQFANVINERTNVEREKAGRESKLEDKRVN